MFGPIYRATINQVNPASGTGYPVLAIQETGVRIIGIMGQCTWTVQPSPLEIQVSMGATTIIYNQTDPVTLNAYACVNSSMMDVDAQQMIDIVANVDPANARAFLVDGVNVGIMAEITGGTVQNLGCSVLYQLLVDV